MGNTNRVIKLMTGPVLVLALVACSSDSGSEATSVPSTSTSGSVPAVQVPEQLRDRWYGPPRELGNLGTGKAAAYLDFDVDKVTLETGNADNPAAFASGVAAAGPDRLTLTLYSDTLECHEGDVGHYTWSVSTKGTTLTLTAADDACAARADAITGGWWFTGCNDPTRNCLGAAEAGTYATNRWNPFDGFTYGELTFALPDDTWAVSNDTQAAFFLEPADRYPGASDVSPLLAAWADVAAGTTPDGACSFEANLEPGLGAANIADYIESLASLDVERSQIEVGGLPAEQLDVQIVPGGATCTDGGTRFVVLTASRDGVPDHDAYGVAAGQRMRVILVDVAPERTVAIYIDDLHPDRGMPELDAAGNDLSFGPLAEVLMPIIESFQFHATPPDVGPSPA